MSTSTLTTTDLLTRLAVEYPGLLRGQLLTVREIRDTLGDVWLMSEIDAAVHAAWRSGHLVLHPHDWSWHVDQRPDESERYLLIGDTYYVGAAIRVH